MSRKPITTKIQEIVDYWSNLIYEGDLSADWADADSHCWRCGCEKNLERYHIVPDALGGKDEPENLVLLCKRCHAEGPNVTDPQIMWDWIKSYKVNCYDTFWMYHGLREYQFIYKNTMKDDLKEILNKANISGKEERLQEELKKILASVGDQASVHFGQPYFNSATMAGMYRMTLKELAKSLNVVFPFKTENAIRSTPWWYNASGGFF